MQDEERTNPSVTSENAPGVDTSSADAAVEGAQKQTAQEQDKDKTDGQTPPDRGLTREELDEKDPARADPDATPQEQQAQTAGFPGGKAPEPEEQQ